MRFGWTRGYSPSEIYGDPVLSAKLKQSWGIGRQPTTEVCISNARTDRRDVPLRVYCPEDCEPKGTLVWAHGGGFASGDLDMPESDGVARELSHRACINVVTVGYGLVGDGYQYPSLHRDVSEAIDWAEKNLIGPLSVGGASAGANLAVAASLERRDLGKLIPSSLLLAYPLLFKNVGNSDVNMAGIPPIFRVNQVSVNAMLNAYAPDGGDYVVFDEHDLQGLPSTFLLVAELDQLAPQSQEFARKQEEAQVSVTLRTVKNAVHGFLNLSSEIPQADQGLDIAAKFLAAINVSSSNCYR